MTEPAFCLKQSNVEVDGIPLAAISAQNVGKPTRPV